MVGGPQGPEVVQGLEFRDLVLRGGWNSVPSLWADRLSETREIPDMKTLVNHLWGLKDPPHDPKTRLTGGS